MLGLDILIISLPPVIFVNGIKPQEEHVVTSHIRFGCLSAVGR